MMPDLFPSLYPFYLFFVESLCLIAEARSRLDLRLSCILLSFVYYQVQSSGLCGPACNVARHFF